MIDLGHISTYLPILPFLTGVLAFKQLSSVQRKLLIFITVSVCAEFSNYIGGKYLGSNMPVFHIYTWLEISIIYWIIGSMLEGRLKFISNIIILSFLIFSGLNVICNEGLFVFNSAQSYVGGICSILFCLFYFTQVILKAEVEQIEKEPLFILASIWLIYYAGTLFVFILADQILTDDQLHLWSFHSIINIILNIGYLTVLWMGIRKSRLS